MRNGQPLKRRSNVIVLQECSIEMLADATNDAPVTGGRFAPIFAQMGELSAVFLALAVLAIGVQLKSNCYSADFGGDEASHYVSGLAIRDYLMSGFGTSPMGFIWDFHSHYALIGIGHWGPLYYCVEALWMLIFSTGLASVLALSLTVTATTALLIYAQARHLSGRWAAFFAACAFILVPLVQAGTSELMLDIPVALLCLWAMYAYVRYVEAETARYAVAFAIIAAAAMLIKGNAACLALLPPLTILLTWRFDLLKRVTFWLPVPIVAVIVGPWYVLTYGMVAVGFRYHWGWDYVMTAVTANSTILLDSVGPMILVAALVGVGVTIARVWRRRATPLLSAACGLVFAVWIFQSIAPAAIEDRYLAPLLGPLLLLAVVGAATAARSLKRHLSTPLPLIEASIAAILLLSVVPAAIAVPRKPTFGFMAAASEVWKRVPANNRSILVISNGLGEASAIAALAMYDPHRPDIIIVRGSRLLGGGGYNNQDYVARFKTVSEVTAAIDDYAIPLVLFRMNFPGAVPWGHVDQVAGAIESDPTRWQQLYRSTEVNPPVMLFEARGNESKPMDEKRLLTLTAPRS
jgi:hypothetical protein